MDPMARGEVSAAIDRWADTGLITPQQADSMRHDLAAGQSAEADGKSLPPRPGAHLASWVIEALGYLGGAIIVVAIGLVVGNSWGSMPVWAHVVLLAGTAVLAGVGGFLIPQTLGGAGIRLRSVLLLASTAAWTGTVAYCVTQVFEVSDQFAGLTVTLLALPVAAGYWWAQRQPLQHGAFFLLATGTAAFTAVAIVNPPPQFDGERPFTPFWIGLGVWLFTIAWLCLGLAGRVRPPWLGVALGAAGIVFAGMMMAGYVPGAPIALVSLAALLVLAVWRRDFLLLVITAIGTLFTLPQVVMEFFPGRLSAALTLFIVGAVLIGAAVVIARRRGHRSSASPPPPGSRDHAPHGVVADLATSDQSSAPGPDSRV